jgi:hypothetical protein
MRTRLSTEDYISTTAVLQLVFRPTIIDTYREYKRWVCSVQEECLVQLMLFGEASLRQALRQYGAHLHHERYHQGKGTVPLLPVVCQEAQCAGPIQGRARRGGLLKYDERNAACL